MVCILIVERNISALRQRYCLESRHGKRWRSRWCWGMAGKPNANAAAKVAGTGISMDN